MPNIKIYKFRDLGEADLFLNGGILGGDQVARGFNVVGKTLHFAAPGPVGMVTFATGSDPRDPYRLYFKDVKAQVEGAIPQIQVFSIGGRIAFRETNPTGGLVLRPVDDTDANLAFGFDANEDTVGLLYQPSAVSSNPPCLLSSSVAIDGSYVLYTWE